MNFIYLIRKIYHKAMGVFGKKPYVKNYFSSEYSQSVLLCYITGPFLFKSSYAHTNLQEAKRIAKVFSELGYNVDVVDYNYKGKIDYAKYDIVFGFGNPYENSFFKKDNLLHIYYATGCENSFQNFAELNRIIELHRRKNQWIPPERLLKENWSVSTMLSDAMIILGNSHTRSTYDRHYHGKKYLLNATAFIDKLPKVINKDFSRAKSNFLWFGGNGLVLKGLDLCLEIFSREDMQEYGLHICAKLEKDFFKIYENEFKKRNIHFHGFVDITGKKFKELVSICAFGISPSFSEGQATAVLTAMGVGLIPIASVENGIDIDDLGFSITGQVEMIATQIKKSAMMDDAHLAELSNKNYEYIRLNHNIDQYEKNIKQILASIIK